MTNTINVPRELLENIVLCYNEGDFELGTLAAECHALLSAPSSAGVDGLVVVAYADSGGALYTAKLLEIMAVDSVGCEPLCRLTDAKAIIDGLRGEVAGLRKRAKTAEREAGSALRTYKGLEKVARVVSDNSDQVCGELNVLRQQFDQQAQRIGELASHLEFAVTMLTVAGLDGNAQVAAMRAALSDGKEGE